MPMLRTCTTMQANSCRLRNGRCGQGRAVLKSSTSRTWYTVRTVAVDLDGTICEYDGWMGEDSFGEVRSGAREALEELRRLGWRIIVFTTRGNQKKVSEFLDAESVPHDYVNYNPDQPQGSSGKVVADVYVDDRAVNALASWDEILADVLSSQEGEDPTKYWANGRSKDRSLTW